MFGRFAVLVCLGSLAIASSVVAQATIDSDVEITCPTYVQPTCRTDQEVVSVDVPQQFQRAGCPVTMPVCKNLPQTASTTPSRQCGAKQQFNNSSGRCENTDAACPLFMRLCTVGEAPDQLCSCSPTEASVRGPLPCVAGLSCPDNRLLNCDATRQTAKRTCFVQVTPTTVTTPTTPTTETDPAKLCQVEYSQRLATYNSQIPDGIWLPYGNMDGGQSRLQTLVKMLQDPVSYTRAYIPGFDIRAASEWYGDWVKRCAIYFPGVIESMRGDGGHGSNHGNYGSGNVGSGGSDGMGRDSAGNPTDSGSPNNVGGEVGSEGDDGGDEGGDDGGDGDGGDGGDGAE